MIGPRDSVIAHLRGEPYDWLNDTSEWIMSEAYYWYDLHEVWIDKIHDYVWGERLDDEAIYDDGFNVGYGEGYNDGHEDGWRRGYKAGYEDGKLKLDEVLEDWHGKAKSSG